MDKDRKPFLLPREELGNTRQIMNQVFEDLGGQKIDPKFRLPDHVREARIESSISFLEKELLPSIRDNANLTEEDIRQMAGKFISKRKEELPDSFGLEDPMDLICAASANLLPLQITFRTRKYLLTEEDKKVGDLLNKADKLLTKILEQEVDEEI